ncbi:Ca2-binding protein [Aureococcus anophagefferens]|nr:Ca2-binding protein [Aureococcus anophagefferens]
MVLNLITRDLSKPKASRVAPSLLTPSLPEEKVDGDERIARQASPISITEDDFTIGDLVGESMAEGLRAVTPSPEILRESTAPGLAAAGSPPSPRSSATTSRASARRPSPATATPSPRRPRGRT